VGINTPGKAIMYLIDLLEYNSLTGAVVTMDTVVNDIYPEGFYSDKTCTYIIDNVLKPNKTEWSWLY
jgi:hypothetical protein